MMRAVRSALNSEPVRSLRHNDRAKGFIRVTVTPEAVEADFVTVSTIRRRGYTPASDSRWRVTRGPGGLELDVI